MSTAPVGLGPAVLVLASSVALAPVLSLTPALDVVVVTRLDTNPLVVAELVEFPSPSLLLPPSSLSGTSLDSVSGVSSGVSGSESSELSGPSGPSGLSSLGLVAFGSVVVGSSSGLGLGGLGVTGSMGLGTEGVMGLGMGATGTTGLGTGTMGISRGVNGRVRMLRLWVVA